MQTQHGQRSMIPFSIAFTSNEVISSSSNFSLNFDGSGSYINVNTPSGIPSGNDILHALYARYNETQNKLH